MEVREIAPEDAARQHEQGAVLLDVREQDEYETVRAPGALLIPMGDVPERIDEIPTGAQVNVICAVGNRSKRVAEYLLRQDFDAANVAGGMRAWAEAGLPTVAGPIEQPRA